MASAAFFIACCVAVAASLAASAGFLFKSSSFDCCSLSLALKSATELFHQRAKSSKKPRFSAGACDAAAAGAGSGGCTSCGEPCGSGCGAAAVAGAAGGADGAVGAAGGDGPFCANAIAPAPANSTTSTAPRAHARVACTVFFLLLAAVMATPAHSRHGLFTTSIASSQASPRHLLGHGKLGREIGRQQGKARRTSALKLFGKTWWR